MKTVLIATLGGSLQVVTETLWALMNPERTATPRPPEAKRIPGRIHMIATGFVADRESEIRDRIAGLYESEGYPPPNRENVVFDVVENDSGGPLNDIRTADENGFFARHIAKVVRGYAHDPNLRIHLSLAGGRKTMSSYALSAAMFFGRPQDEISHVLVSPPQLESHPDFWWPGQPARYVVRRTNNAEGAVVETRIPTANRSASIDLVSVPFVPLSPFLPDGKMEEATDPTLVVRRIRSYTSYLSTKQLVVDFEGRTLLIGEEIVTLTEKEFALYALLALARTGDWSGAGPDGVGEEHSGWIARSDYLKNTGRPARTLVAIWEAVRPRENEERDTFVRDLLMPPDKRGADDPLASGFSKLSSALERKIANPYLIGEVRPGHESGKRSENRRGLVLPRERINMRNVPHAIKTVLSR